MKQFDHYYYALMYDNALIESVIRIQLVVAVLLLSNLLRLLIASPSRKANGTRDAVSYVHLLSPRCLPRITGVAARLEGIPRSRVEPKAALIARAGVVPTDSPSPTSGLLATTDTNPSFPVLRHSGNDDPLLCEGFSAS